MERILNTLAGILFGIAPMGVTAIFSIIIYDSSPNYIGIIGIILLAALTLWLGISIFKTVLEMGPLEFISRIYTTPELNAPKKKMDHLTKNSTISLEKKDDSTDNSAIQHKGDISDRNK